MRHFTAQAAWILAMGCGIGLTGAGCRQGARARAKSPTPAGWTQVYAMDFKDVQKAPPEWAAVTGEVRVAGGALELKAETGSDGEIILKAPTCPGSVRMEAVVCLVGAGDEVCDLSPILNADETGYAAGYLLQFGGEGNQENRIRRTGEIVGSSVNTWMRVKAGQKYSVVAENDGGNVRLVIDGQELLSFKDTEPLKGPGQGHVGFYTWGDTLRVEKIAVYGK